MTTFEEKKGLNEAKFRDANEDIESIAQGLLAEENVRIPFLCECTDPHCTQIVRMGFVEYEGVRAQGNRGFVVPGHEDPSVERVVERHDGYFVAEKFGRAGEVAEERDRRE